MSAITTAEGGPPAELLDFAHAQLRQGSRSFAGAARLFDPEARLSASLLYAWCRHCDDVIDEQVLGRGLHASAVHVDERLRALRAGTARALAGEAEQPAFAALAWVTARHPVPECYPLQLLEGFAMDARDHAFASIEDTLLYSYHVAGVVGLMMAIVMGVEDRTALRRACDLGVAFQLTNIARDVAEDAERGRVYLPADWLAAAGVSGSPAAVAAAENAAAVHSVVLRLLDLADGFYASARHGLRALPFRRACAIATALNVYRGIGSEIRAGGAAALGQRAVVPPAAKLRGLLRGVAAACRARTTDRVRAAPERRGLWTHPGLDS